MNIVVIIILFVLSGIFHQSLYLLIPLVYIFHTSTTKNGKVELDRFTNFFIGVVITIGIFFIIQSVIDLSVDVYSIKGLARYINYLLLLLLFYSYKNNSIEIFFKYVILFFIFSLPYGVYQFATIGRYQNFFSHANHLAHIIVFCIYILYKHKLFSNYIRMICFGILLVSIFLTKTSGALLVLILLAIYNFILSKRISLTKKIYIIFGPFLLLLPLMFKFSDKIVDQINSLAYLQWDFLKKRIEEFKPGGYGSFIWRIIYWLKIYFSFLEENGLRRLFGIGIDSLTKGHMPYRFMYTDPHNDFLKILIEFGYVGLLLFLGLLMKLFLILYKNIEIMIIILIPMLFDNAIVNFSFILFLILIIVYEYRKNNFHFS